MKKFFGTLLAALVLLTATATHAAKVQPLAEIDAYNFFLNMGYEVDCSHWERYEGKQLYAVMIPEEPLIISKDFANIELCAEMRKDGRVVDVTLFFNAGSSGDEMSVIATKVFRALDEAAFDENQAAIEQSLYEFLSTPKISDATLNFGTKQIALAKEISRDAIIITIKPASMDA